ncbi:benzoate 4-monooxygenase cytochrome P450 [Ilyonectria robusta]|uniref:benzoate 4-monooxygenase cytochrome P450 n=1 Tax=Ilyonectria robusta TaxID=1079257 RepID=UPI001E8E40AF|nr:benzoate 4-monooxygenase cytochrome P450 [Ilyonectria robusta]KAH8680403.1 benzoate 4-monooxygenase cytochrome P450 [Ilyonectria robusta]
MEMPSLSTLSEVVSRPAFWVLVACLFSVHIAISRVRSWYRLRHIKGPRFAAWTDLWLINKTRQGSLFEELGDVCKQYGSIARIAPNYIVCGDPEEVRRMWGVRSQFDRAPWYKGFRLDPPRDCTLSMRGGDVHSALRSKLAPGYSGKDVDGLHESIDAGIARFVTLLEDKYLSTATEYRPVDFARKAQYMTLDVISKIAFGESFGFMDRDEDLYDYIRTVESSVPMMQMFALIPWLVNLLQSSLCKAMVPSERDAVGLGPIMAIAKRVVGERYTPKAVDRKDMLGSFVRHGLEQKEAEAESLVQIIAGSDTTATVLRTVMVHVVTNPTIYRRLQVEIDSAVANQLVSSPITHAEAKELPLLQACIKEGFRMWPPISGIMPRISDSDAVVCGIRIPAGTNVAWSARAVMRNESVFGVGADMFLPDRWLRADEEQRQAMENTIDLCFGQGRWGCLGRPIACIELNKMTVELIRRFDFSVIDMERPIRNSFFGVLIQSELNMRITRREDLK